MKCLSAALIGAGFCLAPMAQAQTIHIDAQQLNSCVQAGGGSACIGTTLDGCMQPLGGWSTPAHQACVGAEYEWWDGYLNAVYRDAVARSRGVDARSSTEGTPNRPSDEEALRGMQRAWIGYRDAACNYTQLQWWGGTGASGAFGECLTRLTAEQALTLGRILADG